MKKKVLVLSLAAVLLVVAAVGGTLAWLTAETEAVVNTFTVGNVKINLDEHDYLPETNTLSTTVLVKANNDYKMVPGRVLPKDPFATVIAGSEKCYLFVKIEKSANADNFLAYAIDDGVWAAVTGQTGVYYKVVDAAAADQTFNVLKDQKVTVKDAVTQTMMDALAAQGATLPSLTFTAYAIQFEGMTDVADAWAKVTA